MLSGRSSANPIASAMAVALRLASFNASSEGNAVQMRHIHGASLEEVRKLKRLPRPGEFDGWTD